MKQMMMWALGRRILPALEDMGELTFCGWVDPDDPELRLTDGHGQATGFVMRPGDVVLSQAEFDRLLISPSPP